MKWTKYLIGGIVLLFLVALFIYNTRDTSIAVHHKDEPWNADMVEGSDDAPHKMIEYTDYFCQFCADFHQQVNSKEFQEKYIETGEIRLESRINAILEANSPNSKQAGEAAFCAADQDKFKEYSDDIIPRIKKDFFDKGIGVKVLNGQMVTNLQKINKLPLDYFKESAKNVRMNVDNFADCMRNHTFEESVEDNTTRAMRAGVTGLPYIVIDDYKTTGFDGTWSALEMTLRAAGVDTK